MAYVEIQKEETLAVITINRPQALNALNTEVLNELAASLDVVEKDNEVKAVIITGGGTKAFVAGADIGEMQNKNVTEAYDYIQLGQGIFERIENFRTPVIAAVNGFAFGGGCELALACDIRIASDKAKFGQPEVGLGIIPGFGGTQRLPRLVGKGKALELILTGNTINAAEALGIGLVNKVTEGDALEAAKEMAKVILAKSPVAVSLAKQAVHYGLQCDVKTGIATEASYCSMCFGCEDQKEGMRAFAEKRKANFTGR